jgi:hypothetical protein
MNNHRFKKGDLVAIKDNLDPSDVAIFIKYVTNRSNWASTSALIVWSNGKSSVWLADLLQLVTRANEK